MIVYMRIFFYFKENVEEEIKNDILDNDYISEEVIYLLDEKLIKGKLYYIFVWYLIFSWKIFRFIVFINFL